MNFRTTVVLFVLVVAVGTTIFFLLEKAPPPPPSLEQSSALPAQDLDTKLIDESFGDPVEVIVRMPDQPDWKFVKDKPAEDADATAPARWRLVEPTEAIAQTWQVDQIGNTLKGLTYAVKYGADSNEVTPENAGLKPPRAAFLLTDDQQKSIEVRIGRPEGAQETYVALGDAPEIYRAKRSLKYLIKKNPLEYIDRRLFDIQADDIVKIQIREPGTDGEEDQVIELVETGGEWVFQKPTRARAVAEAVKTLRTTFASLNVVSWDADNVRNLSLYGLGDDARVVTVTARSKPADSGTNGESDQPADAETREYAVRIAQEGPIDQTGKVYACRDQEGRIGTLMQTVADKFKPDLSQWRDNRISTQDAMTARSFDLIAGGDSATFVRSGSAWSYELTSEPADRTEVESLLRRINEIQATNFENIGGNPARFGLDDPQATLTLTFDEGSEPLKLEVGGFADPTTKRLVYLRVGRSDAIAKIRINDAEVLRRPPSAYRDRTIISVERDRFSALAIDRKITDQPRLKFTLTRGDDGWSMTEPVERSVDAEKVNSLLAALDGLRARTLIEPDDLATYGLDDPAIRLAFTYLPPVTFQLEPEPADDDADQPQPDAEPADAAGTNGEASADDAPADQPQDEATAHEEKPKRLVPKPYQPPAETLSVSLARRDNKVYLLRDASPDVVYLVEPALWEQLGAEFLSLDLFSLEPSSASVVRLEEGDQTQGFSRTGDGWEYLPESDIPVDPTKITNYLLRISELKPVACVEYESQDLAAYGLDKPQYRLTVESEGEPQRTLEISEKTATDGHHYAKMSDSGDVLVLPADALDRIRINVAEFEQAP